MTTRLGSQAIVVGTTQIFNTPSTGLKGLIIDNASPFVLTINLQGSSLTKTLQPAGTDFFEVFSGFNGNVVYSSSAEITNPQSFTNYTLSIDAVGAGESIDISQFPVARPMPAVTATASGQPIFSATFGIGNSANNFQALNIYNPANSGVSFQFHSCRIFTNNNQLGMAAAINALSGADLNLSTSVPIVSHDISSNPPVSSAHCTAIDGNTRYENNLIEVLNTQQNETLDFLIFPDQIILRPGNNLTIQLGTLSGGVTAGTVVRLTAKWTEVPQISGSGSTGGATTGNILTAATVVNDNSPAGTGVVSAHPNGDNVNALFMDNAGNVVIGSLQENGDFQVVSATLGGTIFHIRALDNTIFLDGAQPFPGDGFTFHSEDGTNQIHVVDTGATFSHQAIFSSGIALETGSISRMSIFTANVSTTPTSFPHGLGAVPTGIWLQVQGGVSTVRTVQYNPSVMDATNVQLTGSGSFTVIGWAIAS